MPLSSPFGVQVETYSSPAYDSFLNWMSRFRKHLGQIEKAMGILLILFGVLIATETINWIANWMVMFWPTVG